MQFCSSLDHRYSFISPSSGPLVLLGKLVIFRQVVVYELNKYLQVCSYNHKIMEFRSLLFECLVGFYKLRREGVSAVLILYYSVLSGVEVQYQCLIL